ncbi:mucin-2-like [Macrosteles quadrilineatus]|uniref:mucin-2-like n=1 Tax=Macrosteles quadrilineatus TaxID=74068 RepID=UPI0023E2E517|nr:mucin-2-like [Macrosteles quadrilineatus]
MSGEKRDGLVAFRNDGDGWRPVRDSQNSQHSQHSQRSQLRIPPPTSAYYMNLGVHKKHFLADPVPSNKVEVFAPAPPSILGSFSGFGHDTVKSRHPVKHKKPFKELHQAESRPGYTSYSPFRHSFAQPFQHNDNVGQAYYFEASLSPPPSRESGINLVPPPSSKAIAPNSFYFQQYDQTRTKAAPTFSPYLRQGLPIYTPEYFKSTSPSTDPYRFFSPDPPSKQQFNPRPTASHTTNSHGIPPGIDYFGNNPFGDIHLNTNKPDTKTPAKDIFDQLSHLGRPFQSSTLEPPRVSQPNAFSSVGPFDYFSTGGNYVRQTTPKPFRPSPLISDSSQSTERPPVFVTPGPSQPSRDIFSIPVTTLDVPSRDDVYKYSSVANTYQPFRETQQYHEEVTGRPTKSSILTNTYQSVPETQQYQDEVTVKPSTTTYYRRPEVEVNTNGDSIFHPTPFLPTPTTDLDHYVGEPSPTDVITPSSETNEVNNPTRTRTSRPRYRKKKPSRKPENQKFAESTTENNVETPVNEYTTFNEEAPKVTTYDTDQNTYQSQQFSEHENEKVEDKPKRRRPARPNNHQSTSTLTNTEADVQEIPTAFSTLPEEDIKTSPPSSSTTDFNQYQNRRRKKPSNRVRGVVRHGATRITTSTAEPSQDIANDFAPNTEYQLQKETVQTENYPVSGLSFNEYGHIMPPSTEEHNSNTLYPTQQVEDFQTNYHETVSPTSESTTTTTTTTPEPETSSTTPKSRRNKYNYNNTRPRFSVKDYRERLNKATSTTTEAPKGEISENNESLRIRPPRLRGNISYRPENQDDKVETSTRRFKPKYTGQRHAYRTSTTQSPLVQLDTPTTTERQNTFKPSNIRRPGSNKTSTEPPTGLAAEETMEKDIAKLPVRPKGVFSAKKRKPFPLRTRNEPENKTEETQAETVNDLDHDQYITKKSDNIATTTLMTSSEEVDWNTASSEKPKIVDSADHGDITKKIADLTSSPSNAFDSSGFFKSGVSPSSRRTVGHITLATDDPILPIEAFFSSSFNKNDDSR